MLIEILLILCVVAGLWVLLRMLHPCGRRKHDMAMECTGLVVAGQHPVRCVEHAEAAECEYLERVIVMYELCTFHTDERIDAMERRYRAGMRVGERR